MRRYARLLRRGVKMASIGVWEVTFPQWMEDGVLRNVAYLKKLKKRLRKAMQKAGYSRGFGAMHPCGDEGQRWRIHFHLGVDGGYLPPDELERIKAIIRKETGADVIHYHFTDKPAEICHHLRYISRPVWGKEGWQWETQMAERLIGFRTMLWWGGKGAWDGPDAFDLHGDGELLAIEGGHCPECGKKLSWNSSVFAMWRLEASFDTEEIPGGYLQLHEKV